MFRGLRQKLRRFLRHSAHFHIAEVPARTPRQLVALFDRFLDDKGRYGLEWDDFISWDQANPDIEAIREELGAFEPRLFSKQPADRLIYANKVVELRNRVAAQLNIPARPELTDEEADRPSERLVDQRIRNRIMEAMLTLVEWRRDLFEWGAVEYFNSFFDFITDGSDLDSNSALTPDERDAWWRVHELISQAAGETPRDVTADQLAATGWPTRIAVPAQAALSLMLDRGRFSEEVEEATPSASKAWP